MKDWSNDVFEVFHDVLEQQAFMFADVCDEFELEDGEAVMQASIEISGETSFRVRVCARPEFARELAENVLGMEEDEGDDVALDSLAELLNVAAGQLAVAFNGPDKVSPLTTPLSGLAALPAADDGMVDVPLEVDEHGLLIRLEPLGATT